MDEDIFDSGFWFFVPDRFIWDHWKELIQDNDEDYDEEEEDA